jgi:4-amino-4-deoxy-L-arabinose transferase-like glycosyltransferase
VARISVPVEGERVETPPVEPAPAEDGRVDTTLVETPPVETSLAVTASVAAEPVAAAPPRAASSPPMPAEKSGTDGTAARTPPVRPATPLPIRWSDLLWLALALLVIVGTGIGIRDPWPADEPRFASLARDMALSGEWMFPRVGGDLYQDKPPLFFWLLAICYSITGSVRWSFLIPSFLAAAGVMFLVYDYGRRTVSREAGLAASLLVVCTLQFVLATRGAQIDATLCFLTTLSLYALLRHLLLGAGWRWYFLGGFAAGLGIFTKGVGFLPILLLIPFFLLRGFGWKDLAPIDGGKGGWRWWLAPLAMLLAVSLWFVPMLIAVANSAPEYAAYRDEILFEQTVNRYAGAWHHVKAWYYFLVEVIPPLWLPWSILLFWLVPRFKAAFHERSARVWLPLGWVLIVLAFFTASPGKRGIYILPALPALAFAAMPVIEDVLSRKGVRRAGFVLAGLFWIAAAVFAIGHAVAAEFAVKALSEINLPDATAMHVYLLLAGAGLLFAWRRTPLAAWPVALGALTIVFSYFIAPAMNPERSASAFVRDMLAKLSPGEQLGLVAYKEQFLLYLDRPTVNFGHRRWREGPQEAYDASAWLNAGDDRVLLLPADQLEPCFEGPATRAGISSDDEWFLVRGRASEECAARGDAARAIHYSAKPL